MPMPVLAVRVAVTMLIAALAAPLAPSPLAADPFFARNKLRVYSTDVPGVMKVVARPSLTAGPQFFCAAGEYARGPLRARAADRLVLVGPAMRDPAFNGQRTVLIQLVPRGTPLPRDRGVLDTLLLSASEVGEHLSVAHAQFLCNLDRRR